jgi:hypothetical protein
MNGNVKFDSEAEKKVATFLKELNIYWDTQPKLLVNDHYDKERIVYPDLYLPEFGIYIEVCGVDRKEVYENRRRLYKQNHLNVIFVETYKPEKKWKLYLLKRIVEIQTYRDDILRASLFEKIFN